MFSFLLTRTVFLRQKGTKNSISHIIKQKTNPKHAQKLRDLGYKGSLTLGTMFLAKTNFNFKRQQASEKRVKIEQD